MELTKTHMRMLHPAQVLAIEAFEKENTKMTGIKNDSGKSPTHLLAHDVVVSDHNPSQDIQFYAARLREWWNRAGTLPALQLSNDDINGLVDVLAFGAKKYSERNWEEGINYSRIFGAAMRHYAGRGGYDPETGEAHRYHFLCCYMFLAAYTARGLHDFDDRPGVGPFFRSVKEIVIRGEPSAVSFIRPPAPPVRYALWWRSSGAVSRSNTYRETFDTFAEANERSIEASNDGNDIHYWVGTETSPDV